MIVVNGGNACSAEGSVTLIVFYLYLVFMRCQRTTVSDLTMVMVSRMRDSDDKQNRARSAQRKCNRRGCSLLQSIELMPQYRYFGLQPPVAT